MKKHTPFIAVAAVMLMALSFFAGSHLTGQKNDAARAERCGTLILFAIEKAEHHDLADQGVMRAVISNVYAACQFCDDSTTAARLHDLWNYLIFESDQSPDSAKEIALRELNAALDALRQAG